MGRQRDLAEALAGVPLFSRCSRGELRTVARHAETVDLPAGEVLMTQGEPGDALYVILDGVAAVTTDGTEVGVLGPGDHVGELALLDHAPRTATVTTTAPVHVAVLGTRMFRTLLRELPSISEQLLAGLAGELRKARAPLR